jgi:hypothetical protein
MTDYAHSKGLIIGMKNYVDLIPDVGSHFDFAVNENCYTYEECDGYSSFRKASKAVFSHIYKSSKQSGSSICKDAAKNKVVT